MPVEPGEYTVPDMGRFGAPRDHGRHRGLDQYAPRGTDSVLAKPAAVLERGPARPTGEYGHWVRYRHLDDGHVITEAHFDARSPLVPGRVYDAGAIVGPVGDSGNASRVGPHDHVEVRKPNGLLVDPARYFITINFTEEDMALSAADRKLITDLAADVKWLKDRVGGSAARPDSLTSNVDWLKGRIGGSDERPESLTAAIDALPSKFPAGSGPSEVVVEFVARPK